MSDIGAKIKFYANELIEDGRKSNNIQLSTICGKCMVIKAHENDSVIEILETNQKYQMAYVCRYKLVKETIYKLVPVSWQPGEEEGTMTDNENCTDNEDCPDMVSLSAVIDELHLSLTSNKDDTALVVSPIKIVNNSVQKVRNRKKITPNKRTSPDADKHNEDVSPNKRNKLNHRTYHELASPDARNRKYNSPGGRSMEKVRKDLSESFSQSPGPDDQQQAPYTSKIIAKDSLKMILSKGVLRERNENTTQSPMNKTYESPRPTQSNLRRSNMKSAIDSVKSETLCACFFHEAQFFNILLFSIFF